MYKWAFFQESIEYLGHGIKPGKLETDRMNTKSLSQAKPPKDKSKIPYLLEPFNVYRRFIVTFTKVAYPLNQQKKGKPATFTLHEEKMQSFRELIYNHWF